MKRIILVFKSHIYLAINKFITGFSLLTICFSVLFVQAQQQVSSSLGPEITCPETSITNICAPVASPAPMLFADFNPSDDNTPTAEIEFVVEESVNILADVTVISQQYTFTDKDGNSNYCAIVYNIANRFIQMPAIENQKSICQDDVFSGLKFGGANYIIYKDDNGKPGNMVGKCDQPGLLCAAENMDVDTSIAGVSKLWIAEFITFPDASICESEAAVLNLEVLENPTAKLSKKYYTAAAGTTLMLNDFVEENESGYWSGEGVFSVATVSGTPAWVFTANGERVTKLYYTVKNGICSQSYLLLVEPAAKVIPLADAYVGFTLDFKKTKAIALGNTTITFTAIEDNRCSVGQTDPNIANACEREGIAMATLEISNDLGTTIETLSVRGNCFPEEFCTGEQKEILGLQVGLTGIYPYPSWDDLVDIGVDDESYIVSLYIASPIFFSTPDLKPNQPYTTKEEDEERLATVLSDIKAYAESIPCENTTDWKFTRVAGLCGYEYVAYPSINEFSFLSNIRVYHFGYLEFINKWNVDTTCFDEEQPIPVSISCVDEKAVINYSFVETEEPASYYILGEEFTLKFNETKIIHSENMTIKFSAIKDARCPKYVNCLVPGWANVEIIVSYNSGSEVSTLQIGDCGWSSSENDCFGQLIELLGYQFKLISLNPYPQSDDVFEDTDYSITLVVEETTSFEEDEATLAAMFANIKTIAESVSCENAQNWEFTAYGSKACGGPQGYIAYSTQIDETAFIESVETYTNAEHEFNIKWGLSSTCELILPPQTIFCVDGKAVLIYSSEEPPASDINLGEAFTLNFNETKSITSENISIKFVEIEDSRCPEEVACIQAGYAIATLEVTTDAGTELIRIGVNGLCGDNCSEQLITEEGLQINLVNVKPYPTADETIEDAQYFLVLLIEKTTSYEEDQAALTAMFANIRATAESVVCDNAEDWSFTAYGSKPCGGPSGYIAYSTQIDVTAFSDSIQAFSRAQINFNGKWRLYSTCDIQPSPQNVICVDGAAVLNYGLFEPISPLSTTNLTNAQNAFALDIFKQANAIDAEDENIIISPLSVAIALAMVSNGANGQTLDEFKQVMHLSDFEQANINAGYLEYIQKLQNLDENLSLEIANAVFYYDKGIAVNPEFIETVEQYYNAEIEAKDFLDEATVTDINNWVKANTDQKIEKIINEIGSTEVMFLLNAIYFNGGWSQPFDANKTAEGSFTLEDGSVETVEMMGHRADWQIYNNANLKALNIPLGDSIYNMLFILPENENTALKNFAANFSQSDFEEITIGLTEQDYEIKIPKFELAYENKMKDDLTNLGLVLAFEEANADLSNLGSAGGNLYVSRVIHKTFLKIDEEGATAAAVTAVAIAAESIPPSVNLNRPFLCLIWEKTDNSIVFLAKIMNPNAP